MVSGAALAHVLRSLRLQRRPLQRRCPRPSPSALERRQQRTVFSVARPSCKMSPIYGAVGSCPDRWP
eukprot:5278377-Lingulodinium_polyedra.AAC.1